MSYKLIYAIIEVFMNKIVAFIFSVSAVFYCGAQSLSGLLSEATLLDGVAAEVGKTQITIADVTGEAREMAMAQGTVRDFFSNRSIFHRYYSQALTNQINRALVLNEYERNDAKIPDWYFNDRIEQIVNRNFKGNRSLLVEELNKRGISFDEWRKQRINDMIFMAMQQQFVDQGIKLSPAAVNEFYNENYANAKLSGRVKVSMIMMQEGDDKAAKLAEVKELVAKLRKGESFEDAAKVYSIDSHAKDGGAWGYVEPVDEFRKEIADVIGSLKVKEVSDPLCLDGFIYIVRKDDERKDLSVPLALVRDEIDERLFAEIREKRMAEWFESLREKSTVRVYGYQDK